MIHKRYSLGSTFLLISLFLSLSFISCKKSHDADKQQKGSVLFKTGEVTITRNNATIQDIKVKDSINNGDIISTGKGSFIIMQLGSNSVLRVQENTTVIIKDLISGKLKQIYLQHGELLSKVKRLRKDENFTIQTGTIVASVRGTEFKVSTSNKSGSVSVSSGKVMVKPVLDQKKSIEELLQPSADEKLITKGSAIDFAPAKDTDKGPAVSMDMRKITPHESLILEKISSIEVYESIDNIKNKNLQPLHEKIEHNEKLIDQKLQKMDTGGNSSKQQKIKALIAKKSKTLNEIKEVFEHIDQITLFNGRIITGAILSKKESIHILTTTGTVVVAKKDIKLMKVIQ